MNAFPRYAIYYVPAPDDALYRFGAETLGYDVFTGDDVAFCKNIVEQIPDWRDITADARKYGFHATLKAPFALASDTTEDELIATCAAFCAQPHDIPMIKLRVTTISGFVALTPTDPSPSLARLAADCVIEFEKFRGPLQPGDRVRRNPSKLTDRQVKYLDQWGYPYVMDEFQFHMTLTGRLHREQVEAVMAIVSDRFSKIEPRFVTIDQLGLFRQEAADERFRIIYASFIGHRQAAPETA